MIIPVTTVTFGSNAALIAEVCSLYVKPDSLVADVTYGTGRFWKEANVSTFKLLASDLRSGLKNVMIPDSQLSCDFRNLPYLDSSIDVVVFDPPYIHAPGKGMMSERYGGKDTTDLASYSNIMSLYKDGMKEANRILRDGGQLWVKCKDTLSSDRQRWSHINVFNMSESLGMYARDLFILIPPSPLSVTTNRWARQLHARKTHSYLWVFETGGFKRRG
jgi:tRNA G10  N-methylase Trm11